MSTQTARRLAPILTKALPPRQLLSPPEPVEIPNPLQYLLDTGLLFEWNRTAMHPNGLVMSIRPTASGKLELAMFDCSENPTVTFEPPAFERGVAKKRLWWKRGRTAVHALRVKMLGFSVQTEADYRNQPRNK